MGKFNKYDASSSRVLFYGSVVPSKFGATMSKRSEPWSTRRSRLKNVNEIMQTRHTFSFLTNPATKCKFFTGFKSKRRTCRVFRSGFHYRGGDTCKTKRAFGAFLYANGNRRYKVEKLMTSEKPLSVLSSLPRINYSLSTRLRSAPSREIWCF